MPMKETMRIVCSCHHSEAKLPGTLADSAHSSVGLLDFTFLILSYKLRYLQDIDAACAHGANGKNF